MREIRFRGREIFKGCINLKWYNGKNIDYRKNQDGNIIFVRINGVRVKPETIGQYTGKRDKDNKKIYEGDIVEITDDTYTSIGFIEYSEICLAFMCNVLMDVGIDPIFLHEFESDHLSVIGNIHDNAYLLEEKK
jgi:uncharacterized phage protein (TIGR01671 family)